MASTINLLNDRRKVAALLLLLIGMVGGLLTIFHTVSSVNRDNAVSLLLSGMQADERTDERADDETLHPNGVSDEQQMRFAWEKPDELLASTSERRQRAIKSLGLDHGEYYLPLISIDCQGCEREVLELNGKAQRERMVLVTVAPAQAVADFKQRLGVNLRVETVSSELFDDLGAVLLPTIVHIKDGIPIAASENAEVIE